MQFIMFVKFIIGLWKRLLQSNFCLTLFRDEVIMIHRSAEEIFTGLKG